MPKTRSICWFFWLIVCRYTLFDLLMSKLVEEDAIVLFELAKSVVLGMVYLI